MDQLEPVPAGAPASLPARIPDARRGAFTLPEVLTAGAGLLALGATIAVGTGGAGALRFSPSMLLGATGALTLTAPALVVGHQYLRLSSPVSSVVDHLALGLVAGGRIAWGVVPVGLFFAATAPASWPLFVGMLGLGVGVTLMTTASLGLLSLAPGSWPWRGAVAAWVAVTIAIGLRLAFSLLNGA